MASPQQTDSGFQLIHGCVLPTFACLKCKWTKFRSTGSFELSMRKTLLFKLEIRLAVLEKSVRLFDRAFGKLFKSGSTDKSRRVVARCVKVMQSMRIEAYLREPRPADLCHNFCGKTASGFLFVELLVYSFSTVRSTMEN